MSLIAHGYRLLLAGVANVEIIDCELVPTRVFVRVALARGRGYKACRVCCARICMPPPLILRRIEIDLKNEMLLSCCLSRVSAN